VFADSLAHQDIFCRAAQLQPAVSSVSLNLKKHTFESVTSASQTETQGMNIFEW